MRTTKILGPKKTGLARKYGGKNLYFFQEKQDIMDIYRHFYIAFVVKSFVGRNKFRFLDCMCNESVKKTCVFESLGDIQNAMIMSLSLSYQNMNVWNAP
jgi:hypothetical protein